MSMDVEEHCREVAARMRAVAEVGTFDGYMTPVNYLYLRLCQRWDAHTNTVLMFTRDVGHCTSGWFKNPDYERARKSVPGRKNVPSFIALSPCVI